MKRTSLLIAGCLLLAYCALAQNKQIENVKQVENLKKVEGKYYIEDNGKDYLVNPTVVTVKFKNGLKRSSIQLDTIHADRLGYIDIAVPKNVDLKDFLDSLKKTGDFETVGYNSYGEFLSLPNDPLLGSQWYLAAVNLFDAWDITTGNPSIKVAIIDAGPDWRHSDIHYGTDNYKNVDESLAWEYTLDTNGQTKYWNHGTRILGQIGAKTNNAIGIAGIAGGNGSAPGITMIPINVADSQERVSQITLKEAILYADSCGANIIQLSLMIAERPDITDAIDTAVSHGAIVVCGSGNYDPIQFGSSAVRYPALLPNVIAVGAIDQDTNRARFSCFGNSLNVVAPGVGIWSTAINNAYNSEQGTSFSGPIVSGILSLMLSVNPNLTLQQAQEILERTAHKIGGEVASEDTTTYPAGFHKEVGWR